MKFTKSILRPVRATRRGGAASLSFLRGGGHQASTFFAKKRGGAFDTHEPSSPKVTCIGQVRVKSKKRVKQCRRRIGGVSFRVAEQSHGGDGGRPQPQRFSSSSSRSHRDPRWVHLPMSALRAFRAEIFCFFPCRCSCFSTRGRESGGAGATKSSGCSYTNENGCGAVFTRWLVAVNGGDGGKRREIEVVVGDDQQRSCRHVFEDVEVKDEDEEESGRVSICIPPKNALLLMRCRSDPMKMTALASRFCLDAPKYQNGDIQEEEEDNDESLDSQEQLDNHVSDQNVAVSVEQNMQVVDNAACAQHLCEEKKIDEALVEESTDESAESGETVEEENAEESTEEEEGEDKKAVEQCTELEAEKPKNGEMAIINGDMKKENKVGGLPDCLLLMMCEPKLSMEVSKETWIRGTDFIRLLPERPRKPAKPAVSGGDQEQVMKRRPSVDSKSKPRIPAPPAKRNDQQPARSSCSLPASSMAAVIERNPATEGKCEPFALTRCKSEPMSTAAAKLMPESC